LGFPEFVSKAMGKMHADFKAGKEVRDLYNSSYTNRVGRTYEFMLAGMNEHNLYSLGFSDYEIDKANAFRKYENVDMLPTVISKKTGLAVSTIRKMQKTYRDSQVKPIETRMEVREELTA
jgi:hypothetical protein